VLEELIFGIDLDMGSKAIEVESLLSSIEIIDSIQYIIIEILVLNYLIMIKKEHSCNGLLLCKSDGGYHVDDNLYL
jgi:hypothetical protein